MRSGPGKALNQLDFILDCDFFAFREASSLPSSSSLLAKGWLLVYGCPAGCNDETEGYRLGTTLHSKCVPSCSRTTWLLLSSCLSELSSRGGRRDGRRINRQAFRHCSWSLTYPFSGSLKYRMLWASIKFGRCHSYKQLCLEYPLPQGEWHVKNQRARLFVEKTGYS